MFLPGPGPLIRPTEQGINNPAAVVVVTTVKLLASTGVG